MSRRLAEHSIDDIHNNGGATPTIHFYIASGGNAGLAAVHAASSLRRPCTVVVPLSTKPMMVAKLRTAGASDVVRHGATWQEADEHLRREVMSAAAVGEGVRAVYVPPFDDEDVWQGNASMMHEIDAQLRELGDYGGEKPAAVVCSVGGGGLFNGVMMGLDALGWGEEVQVLAVETRGADSLNASLVQGEHVTLPAITSQATSLGARRVCDATYEFARSRPRQVKSVVLSDAEAAMGCWRLADDERLLVELACGVSVALCYGGRFERALGRRVREDEVVVIIVCGGSAVTFDMLAQWRREFAWVEEKMPHLNDVPSDFTAPVIDRDGLHITSE